MSMRSLQSSGHVPFTGERGNSLHSSAPDAVSSVQLRNFGSAYDYANSRSGVTAPAWSPNSTRRALDDARTDSSHARTDITARTDLYSAQLGHFNRMSQDQQSLIRDDFPVMYGISGSLAQSRLQDAKSSIPGEVLIRERVHSSEISSIFVPESQVDRVQQLVDSSGSSHIKVSSLEAVTTPRSRGRIEHSS